MSIKYFLKEKLSFLGIYDSRNSNIYYKKLNNKNFPTDRPFDMKLAKKNDLDSRYQNKPNWNSRRQALSKLDAGHSLFIGEKDNKYVFYVWIEQKNINIPAFGKSSLTLPPTVGYLSGLLVPEGCRGQGIGSYGFQFIEAYLLNHTNISEIFMFTGSDNDYAERLFLKQGYSFVQYVRFLELFRMKFFKVKFIGSQNKLKFYFQTINFLTSFLRDKEN